MNEKPEKRFRCSPVSASIWVKTKTIDKETVKFYSVTINRAYKKNKDNNDSNNGNDNNEWQYTQYFRPDDLPKVALLATEAYKYISLSSSSPQIESEQ